MKGIVNIELDTVEFLSMMEGCILAPLRCGGGFDQEDSPQGVGPSSVSMSGLRSSS